MASAWGDSWGTAWGDSFGEQSIDPNRLRGTARGTCTVSGYLTGTGEGFISGTAIGTSTTTANLTYTQVQQGGSGKSRRVYIERDGQILVFAKPALAAAYIEAEKAQSVVETTTKLPKRLVKPKAKVVQPEAVIEIDVLGILVEKYQLPDVNQYIKNHDYEAILSLYLQAQIMQEEDDLEILLLAA